MNIKNIHTASILSVDPKKRVEGNTRAQGSTDRDADGKQDQGAHEEKKQLNQQEFDEALKVLKELPGLKANNLEIKVEKSGDIRIVNIVDSTGKVVRRLSESQLWLATRDCDRQTGRILDKAM